MSLLGIDYGVGLYKNREIRADNIRLTALNSQIIAHKEDLLGKLISYFDPLLEAKARILADQFDLGTHGRVTFYLIEDGYLWPVHRFSENPELEKHRARKYEHNQGCIGHARQHKTAVDLHMPQDPGKWCAHQENRWGIPYIEAQEINTKARCIVCLRIDCDSKKQQLAVVAIETTEAHKWADRNKAKAMLQQAIEKMGVELKIILADYKKHGPSYEQIQKKGY